MRILRNTRFSMNKGDVCMANKSANIVVRVEPEIKKKAESDISEFRYVAFFCYKCTLSSNHLFEWSSFFHHLASECASNGGYE